jgi:hypothetical protein
MGRRQHFVPKLLLRGLSADVKKRTICVHQLLPDSFHVGASLRNQAYHHNLYGADGSIEQLFQDIENLAASILDRLKSGGRPSALPDEDHRGLSVFVLTQLTRTPAQLSTINKSLSAMVDETFKDDPEGKKLFGPATVGPGNPFGVMVSVALQMVDFVSDLRFMLARNPTRVPLVIGDHPAFVVNPLLSYRKHPETKQGIGKLGAVAVLPISEEFLLLLYDPICYKPIRSGEFPHMTPADVDRMNRFQYCYASECVFYSPKQSVDDMRTWNRETAEFRTVTKSRATTLSPIAQESRDEIVWSTFVDASVDPSMSFMGTTARAMALDLTPPCNLSRPHTLRLMHLRGADVPKRLKIRP